MTRVRTHTNPFNFNLKLEPIKPATLFKTEFPVDLEIGVGRGIFLRHWATTQTRNIIGVEIRKQMVDILQERLEATHVENAHLVHSSGERVLEALPDKSIEKVFIFHPDPWLKKKHQKRRVVQPDLLNEVLRVLTENGRLYVSTDVEDLFEEMQEKIISSNQFKQIEDTEFWSNYTSHWTTYSEEDQRGLWQAAFEPISERL